MGNSDTAGYYWCIATVADNPIPSQVVHIQVTNATILSQSNVSSSHSAEDKYKTISLTSVTCHNDDFKPPGTPIATDTPGTPINNTTEPSSTTTERKGSGGRFRTEIVWLAIGVVLALLLLGVVILLAIIAALRCKKRTLKGEPGFVVTSPKIDDFYSALSKFGSFSMPFHSSLCRVVHSSQLSYSPQQCLYSTWRNGFCYKVIINQLIVDLIK